MSADSRENFKLKILSKEGCTIELEVMITDPQQPSFYEREFFFIPALWRALGTFKSLKGKPFFKLITGKRAFNQPAWLVLHTREIIESVALLKTRNFPSHHNQDNYDDDSWTEIWKQEIDLPIATYRLVFADETLLDGFEAGMEWYAAAYDPAYINNFLELKQYP